MPRFIIERSYDIDIEAMPDIGRRSKQITADEFPDTIVWEHSHVVVDEEGNVKSFCVYKAPDADVIREHAGMLGNHVVDRIYEIGGDVTPADFPLSDPAP
jgi:hypothetical protein